MNANMIHNILNIIGLVLGSLISVDWTQLGISAPTAAALAGGVLAANNGVKLIMNIFRDGLSGLFKVQPPVTK